MKRRAVMAKTLKLIKWLYLKTSDNH
jgi:hypothetical protein